jgi:hypothetical protein
MTLSGYMLDGSVGKRTVSYKTCKRVPKSEVVMQVKRHFLTQTIRETDVIVDFIYSVKRQGMVLSTVLSRPQFTDFVDRAFKLQFS